MQTFNDCKPEIEKNSLVAIDNERKEKIKLHAIGSIFSYREL